MVNAIDYFVDVLLTPEHAEKARAPVVERFFSLPAAATLPFLYSDAIEATRYKRAELERPALGGLPL